MDNQKKPTHRAPAQTNVNYYDIDYSEQSITETREHAALVRAIRAFLKCAHETDNKVVWRTLVERFGGDHYRISLAVDSLTFDGSAEVLSHLIPEQIRFVLKRKQRAEASRNNRPTNICSWSTDSTGRRIN